MANEYRFYIYADLDDAHKQGFNAGLHDTGQACKNPVNKYQKEFNRGHKSGAFIRCCVVGC